MGYDKDGYHYCVHSEDGYSARVYTGERMKHGRGGNGQNGGKRYKRDPYGNGGTVGQLLAARRNARTGGFTDIEYKFVDYEQSTVALTTSWATKEDSTALSISAVAQGDGESERDGRIYRITSVHVQGDIVLDVAESSTAPIQDVIARVIVVLDKQTNSAQMTGPLVMDAGGTADWHAFRNLQNTSRFQVLYDKKMIIPVNETNEGSINLFATGSGRRFFKFNKRFKTPIKVICDGTTAVVGSITDNSIHVIAVASSGLANINYQSRVRFVG